MKNRHVFRKKYLAILFSVILVFSSLGLTAFAEETVDDLSEMTTFIFDGDSVTVKEGNDTNYEVVIYDSTDTETEADVSEDADGNTVYSVPEDSEGQLLVSIKKKGGNYVFQGSGNGSIGVKKEATGDAALYLNGLELTSAFTSVITVKKDSTASCTIYAVGGTENTLTDNICNNDENYTENLAAENAVMKFKDSSNVTISGSGIINIQSNGKNGIKANGELEITGNVVLNIDSVNDTINSSGNLNITGGTLNLSAADDAIHADYILNIGNAGGSDEDVTVTINTCSEGLEGATVNIYSGTYQINSFDDCINAANSDLTDYSYELNIYGGNIYAASTAGDCLDSNGDMNISGGMVIVLGALDNTEETNNALDCDGTFTITGGTVLAIGMREMSVVPSSSQAYVTWTSAGISTAVAAGSENNNSGMPDGGAEPANGDASVIDTDSSDEGTNSPDTGDFGDGTTPPDTGDFGDGTTPPDTGDFGDGTTPPDTGDFGDGTTPPDMDGSDAPGGSGSTSGFVSNGDTVTVSDADGNELISVTAVWDSEANYSVDYVLYSSSDVTEGNSYTLAINETAENDNSGDSGSSNEDGGNTDNGDSSDEVTFDSTAWLYNSGSDVYYQTGVVYCEDPYDTTYESFGIYVPAAYMNMTANGDGTYTFVSFTDETVGEYTADSAPIVIPVNTAGYSAQSAPTGFSSGVTTYTNEGIIYLYAGCRGRNTEEGGAPWGVTDLKAAIRYYRANASVLPGDTDSIFTFGHSGGGAQSAVVGASGDSELYYPYLYAIGAAGIEYDETTDTYTSTISDATCGAMCWCPITSLDYADEAYEWMMGQYSDSGTRAEGTWTSLLSDDMSEAFAEYINSLTLEDEDGNILSLTDEGDGIYVSGSYYEYLLGQIEYSLNDFIDSYTDEEGNFSYSSSSSGSGQPGGDMGDMGDMGGTPPDMDGTMMLAETSEGALEDSEDALTEYLLTLDENYGTDEAWITYDEEEDWYSIRSIEDFVLYGSKEASKDVGAFDSLDETQAENYVFGNGANAAAHFDSLIGELISNNYAAYADADISVSASEILAYAEAYQDDYENYTTDSLLGYSSQYRQNMYNPMYYLCQDYEGYGTSTTASYWRINTGITQSDTSLTVETNLYLALLEDIDDGTVEDVDFAMLWAQGHTTAERAGADSDECFIEWISTCMEDKASVNTDDDETGGNTEDADGDTGNSGTGDEDAETPGDSSGSETGDGDGGTTDGSSGSGTEDGDGNTSDGSSGSGTEDGDGDTSDGSSSSATEDGDGDTSDSSSSSATEDGDGDTSDGSSSSATENEDGDTSDSDSLTSVSTGDINLAGYILLLLLATVMFFAGIARQKRKRQ